MEEVEEEAEREEEEVVVVEVRVGRLRLPPLRRQEIRSASFAISHSR